MEQSAVEWTPKNGERVWVKVFSNWSLGTYIGFDTIESKHLVREDAEGGRHLMASSQVLPEDANPNVPKQPTAVEWIAEKVRHNPLMSSSDYNKLLEQAKEMDKEEKIEFACQVAEASAMKYIQGKTTRMIAEELLTFKSE